MTWLPPSVAAERLELAPRTLRERAERNRITRDDRGWYWIPVDANRDAAKIPGPSVADSFASELDRKAIAGEGTSRPPLAFTDGAFVYARRTTLDDTVDELLADTRASPSAPAGQPQRDSVAAATLGQLNTDGLEARADVSNYVFDESRDRYIFSLPSKAKSGKPFVVSGDTIRAVVLAYSNSGNDATLNEIARTQGWHRHTVRDVLRALGKTHDSAPFTDEEIATRGEDACVEDVVRLKEEKILVRAERISWAATKKLAEQAKNFDRFVVQKIDEVIKAGGFAPPSVPTLSIRSRAGGLPDVGEADPFTCVYGLTDLHFGAAGWKDEVGAETTRDIVRDRALRTTERLIERVLRFGRPSSWLVPAGSDNIHADTDLGTTTKGTPLDTDGSFARMFLEGTALYEELITMLLAAAPVEVVAVPGNHDRIASMMLTHWLDARFRSTPGVTVGSAIEHRSYHLHGRALIGLQHGDGMKDEKMPGTMAAEAPEKWGAAEHRVIFTGHLHTDRSNEYAGCRVIHMPCLATADRWHHRKGYVKNTKAIAAHLVDHAEGLVASMPVQPPRS